MNSVLEFTHSGLYCREGAFHIDPWRPVKTAVITHAHADHLSAAAWLRNRTGARLGVGQGIREVQERFAGFYNLGEEFVADGRQFDRLFADADPLSDGRDVADAVDPGSLKVARGWVEPHVGEADPATRWQFERQGYFCVDPDSSKERLVFNRTVTLRDTWAKIRKQAGKK